MSQATPRTDPRIVRTRRMLRDALVELLEEMDVEKISVNRLAERATINRVTFYLHYRDIPDMMEKMAAEMIEDIRAILRSPASRPMPARKEDWPLMVNLLEHIAQHFRFYKVILTTRRTTVFTEQFLKLLTGMVIERIDSPEGRGEPRRAWYPAGYRRLVRFFRLDRHDHLLAAQRYALHAAIFGQAVHAHEAPVREALNALPREPVSRHTSAATNS
ncbi:TetR/AcrR family transcriptional regulator [Cohnella ginsengisoli]|uniref:TetR/AcrR family transcriptional regulator n=1 Tax=Cohnella ginsengisoli TaxID=425004 RepID=A0A9X4QL87_9BACL|nr:TetR/AcrR family transcriptional regulator [Cohnella ginsengisoli]MDG0790474.1 TetR/AcrR family transcriptional regulator [Cohnella ginsengisoli]